MTQPIEQQAVGETAVKRKRRKWFWNWTSDWGKGRIHFSFVYVGLTYTRTVSAFNVIVLGVGFEIERWHNCYEE